MYVYNEGERHDVIPDDIKTCLFLGRITLFSNYIVLILLEASRYVDKSNNKWINQRSPCGCDMRKGGKCLKLVATIDKRRSLSIGVANL